MNEQVTPIERAMEAKGGPDRLTAALRARIQEVIVTVVERELAETMAAQRDALTPQRRGYRAGRAARTITTGWGATTVALSRGWLRQGDQTGGGSLRTSANGSTPKGRCRRRRPGHSCCSG